MLVLTRKCNESVVVGGTGNTKLLARITVLALRNGKVELGFEVDEEIPVHRLEVFERIRAESAGHFIESGQTKATSLVQ